MIADPTDATAATSELEQLRAEVAHLRELVGPHEKSYAQLALDLLAARDHAIAADAAAGAARAQAAAAQAALAARPPGLVVRARRFGGRVVRKVARTTRVLLQG